ncbi:MAG: hypothetical protein AVDCRST_MAG44-613, partial [uncultured Sphingomonas sp.]
CCCSCSRTAPGHTPTHISATVLPRRSACRRTRSWSGNA